MHEIVLLLLVVTLLSALLELAILKWWDMPRKQRTSPWAIAGFAGVGSVVGGMVIGSSERGVTRLSMTWPEIIVGSGVILVLAGAATVIAVVPVWFIARVVRRLRR